MKTAPTSIRIFLIRLTHLTKRKRLKWNVRNHILRCESGFCPITAFTGQAPWAWQSAAGRIGLEEKEAGEIARAADDKGDARLRDKLKKACGITSGG